MRPSKLRSAIHRTLATSVGAAAFVSAALPAQDQDDAEQLETITVVGSRIKRTDIETSQPVFVLEREDLQQTGLTSVGDILQDLAVTGPTLNTTFNNGGNGETRIDLRGLGSNRVLVLVNGRRWVSGLSGAVDLNSVPAAIIERVEILKDGASAIYGSDAISGVINITTRADYDGAEANAYLGENEEGDGRTESYDFTVGSASERASVVMNASYVKQEPVFAGDREISSLPLFGFPGNVASPGQASSTTPYGRFGFGASGGRLPNGAPGTLTLIPGRPGTSTGDFRLYNFATDGFNFAPDNYLLTPQERASVFAQARYQITDSIVFRSEVLYNNRRSAQLLADTPLTIGTGGARLIELGIQVAPDAAFNPFGQTVTRVQRRLFETAGRVFRQDADTFRFAGGFDGGFDLFDRSFTWDVNYTYSDSTVNRTTDGLVNLERVRRAIGPAANCRGQATDGCVPLNLFGGPGSITPQMLNYIEFTAQDEFRNDLRNYTANLTGDLFELPAGPLGFAAGYEYRRVTGFDQPDALTSSGVSSGNARLPTAGGYSLDEFYAEFNLPLLKDLAFAEIFEINLAARSSDYSNFGDTTNGKLGFRWKPITDLLVRGNYSEGFRAPAISELFSGQSDSFPPLTDPCSASSNPAGDVLARCRNGFGGVAGTPAGYQQVNAQIRTTVGGNPNLGPELATTRTLGLVYSPGYLEGLDLFLDWYRIELTGTVGLPQAQNIINNCYVGGLSEDCSTIARDPASGNVIELLAVLDNLGEFTVEGWDFTASYRFDTEFGRFRVLSDNAYFSEWTGILAPLTPETSFNGNYFDRTPTWRLRSNITLDWQRGDWGASLSTRYLSAMDEDCALPQAVAVALTRAGITTADPCSKPNVISATFANAGAENEIDATWYFDAQATWDAPCNARIAGGVRNLTDEEPPVAFSTFQNQFDPQYDVPGRFWYVQYTQRF
jgi:iron complex outermembrane receptor protein